MILINKYISYQCLRCGKYSGMQLNNLYKEDMTHNEMIKAAKKLWCTCKYCSKRMKFKKDNEMVGINHRFFANNLDMISYIQDKNGGEKQVGFQQYTK